MIITFDAYDTLINTQPLYKEITRLADSNGFNADQVIAGLNFERVKVQYGEPYQSYQNMFKGLKNKQENESQCLTWLFFML